MLGPSRGQKGHFTPRGASLPPTPSRGSRGSQGLGEMGREEAHPRDTTLPTPGRGRRRAGSDHTGHPHSGPSPAPPGSACAWCGDAPGRQPLLDCAPAPSKRGQRLPASGARRGWRRGWGGSGDKGRRGPEAPGVRWRAGLRIYLLCGGGARRVAGG